MSKRRTKIQIVVDDLAVELEKRDCSVIYSEEDASIKVTNVNEQIVTIKVKTLMNTISQLNEMHGLNGVDEIITMVMETFRLND